MLGRSELSQKAWFQRLEGKAQVRVVCMDLSSSHRSLVRKHFPNARIVADRFHGGNSGLLSLMRRHRHTVKLEQQPRLLAYLANSACAIRS